MKSSSSTLRLASDATVTGFETHPIYQAVRELVDNGVDASARAVAVVLTRTEEDPPGEEERRVASWTLLVNDDGCGIAARDVSRLFGGIGASTRVDNGIGCAPGAAPATMGRFGVGLKALIVQAQRSRQPNGRRCAPLRVATRTADAEGTSCLCVGIDPRDGSAICTDDDDACAAACLAERGNGTSVAVCLDGDLASSAPRLAAYLERLRALPGSADISFATTGVRSTGSISAEGGSPREGGGGGGARHPRKRRRGALRGASTADTRSPVRDGGVFLCAPSLRTVRDALVAAAGSAAAADAAGAADDDFVAATYLASKFAVRPDCVAYARVATGADSPACPADGSQAQSLPATPAVVVRVFAVLRQRDGGASAARRNVGAAARRDAAAALISPPHGTQSLASSPSLPEEAPRSGNGGGGGATGRPMPPRGIQKASAASAGRQHGVLHVLRYANGRPLLGDAAVCGIASAVRGGVPWRAFGLQVQPWVASAVALTAAGARSKRGAAVLAAVPALPSSPELGEWCAAAVDADEQPLLVRSAIADAPEVPFRSLSLFVDVCDGAAVAAGLSSAAPAAESESGLLHTDSAASQQSRSAVRFAGLSKTHLQDDAVMRGAVAEAARLALSQLRAQLPGTLLSPAEHQARMLRDVFLPTIAAQLARVCALGGEDFQRRAVAAVGAEEVGDVESVLLTRLASIVESTLAIVAASTADVELPLAGGGDASPPAGEPTTREPAGPGAMPWWCEEEEDDDLAFGAAEAEATAARLWGRREAELEAGRRGRRDAARARATAAARRSPPPPSVGDASMDGPLRATTASSEGEWWL